MEQPPPVKPRQRFAARKLALQALYQWHVNPTPAQTLVKQFRTEQDFSKVDADFFTRAVQNITRCAAELDSALQPHLDRPLEKLNPVEHAALRLSCWELKYRPDVPARVVIDQCVSLVHLFGSEGGYKYVNGVLDGLARQLRSDPEGCAAAPPVPLADRD